MGSITYDIIDIITLFEHYNSLTNYIIRSRYFSNYLDDDLSNYLKQVRKRTNKWTLVRNKIGGHLDIDSIIEFCENYNFKGVLISENPEVDFKGVILRMMLESAVNFTLSKNNDLFDSKLELMKPLDMQKFMSQFNSDWTLCNNLFEKFWIFLYKIGKDEKLSNISDKDIGIIKF